MSTLSILGMSVRVFLPLARNEATSALQRSLLIEFQKILYKNKRVEKNPSKICIAVNVPRMPQAQDLNSLLTNMMDDLPSHDSCREGKKTAKGQRDITSLSIYFPFFFQAFSLKVTNYLCRIRRTYQLFLELTKTFTLVSFQYFINK